MSSASCLASLLCPFLNNISLKQTSNKDSAGEIFVCVKSVLSWEEVVTGGHSGQSQQSVASILHLYTVLSLSFA